MTPAVHSPIAPPSHVRSPTDTYAAFLSPSLETAERRVGSRLMLELPAALRNSRDQHWAASLLNLSETGLQMRCSPATARLLQPSDNAQREDARPLLQITVALPLAGHTATLSVCAELQYVREPNVLQPDCLAGFRLLGLRPRAQRLLHGFLAEYAPTLPTN